MYYNDVQGVLVCFDLTDEESFSRLNFWLQDLQNHAPDKIVKILVGLKHDLVSYSGGNQNLQESEDSMFRDTIDKRWNESIASSTTLGKR